nr:hypothetical protein [Tanacetum cinerariifolium]
HEVNEIRAEKIARVANPLALVAQQQPVYHPQNHPTHYTQNSSTRSQQTTTRNRGKAIVNSPQPIYNQEPPMVAEDDETSQDKEIDKLMALISLSSAGYENQRIGNVAEARETVEQPDWRDDTDDDELEDQELEAHYMYMAQLQEVSPDAANFGPIFDDEPLQKVSNDDHYNVFSMESKHPEQSESVHDTYPIDQDAHNVIINSLDMSYDREEIDQNNDDNDLANEPPESDEVIRLKKENRSKLSDLIRHFDYNKLNNLYDLFVPEHEKSSEQRYFSERSRLSHTSVNNGNSKEAFNKQTTLLKKRMDESIPLDKKCQSSIEIFKVKTCLNEEMVADLRYFNSLELEVDSLRSQLETQKTQFLNEIDRLSREYYYADHINAILGVYTKLDKVTNLQCDYLELLEKCECHETEISKSKMMSKSFEALQKHAINLEIDLQQCQEKIKNDKSFTENMSKEFRKEREQYFEIPNLKAQLQDKGIVISELKKLIEKLKGKSVDTKFEKSSLIRQSNAFKSQRPSVLGKPTTFLNSFV